jgi:hypothetical protein
MSDCISVLQANDFLSKDSNRITGRIARSLAINSPWLNVIDTSTFESGVSDIQRSIVQEAIAPVLSQATPNWAGFSCTRTPGNVVTGTTEYQYTPVAYFERGPKICVTQAFSSFRNSIRMAEMAITDHVQTLWNSWIRYMMYANSGQKMTVVAGLTVEQMIAQGYQTPFPLGLTPNAPINFQLLKAVANHLTHVNLAGNEFQWGSGMSKHFRFISDQDTIDALRDEANVRSDIRYLAAGAKKEAQDALLKYSWEGPYQGIGFGVDQSIMRCSGIHTATGLPNFIEPFIPVATTKGTKRAVNPSWLNAPYQISFLMASSSFVREIPEEFLGEGMTRFDKQFWGGKVIWHNQKDNDCNIKGDTGFHYYDLAAAMRPERPEFVIPIIHARCTPNYNLVACTPQGYYSNSI